MIKHRFPALALTGAMLFTLAACGPKAPAPSPEPTQTPNVTESVQPTE